MPHYYRWAALDRCAEVPTPYSDEAIAESKQHGQGLVEISREDYEQWKADRADLHSTPSGSDPAR